MIISLSLQIVLCVLFSIYIFVKGYRNHLYLPSYLKLQFFNVTAILFDVLLYRTVQSSGDSFLNTVAIALMFVMTLSLIPEKFLLDRVIEKRNIDEEYAFLVRKEELNKKYFSLLSEYEKNLSTLRHDYVNQIEVLEALAAKEHSSDAAYQMIKQLREEVESTKMEAFTYSKEINIVLSMLKKKYDQANIPFDIDVLLTGKILVNAIDICMILETLLGEWDVNGTLVPKKISLSGKIKNNRIYLSSSIQFTADLPKEVQKISKSYDKYLSRFIEHYNGEIDSSYSEQTLHFIVQFENISV